MIQDNFWHTSQSPMMLLAPMEDVTDTVFREIVLRNSTPDMLHIVYTEFTSTDGMCHPLGKEKVSHRLLVNESERQLLKASNTKIIAQIWGNNPDKFHRTIKMIQEEGYKFDGIDINMGCPVRNVVSHGSCSALINQPSLAREIIHASKEASVLPLSVKTRLGVKQTETERWISHLLDQPIDALIIHGRIQKQMSEGEANWNEIEKAVKLRDQYNSNIKIIGNGDILSLDEAHQKVKDHGVDGVMIGRGIFKNPWLFSNQSLKDVGIDERMNLLWAHVDLFTKTWGNSKNFAILKRFFKIYISGFDGASELRQKLMLANSKDDVYETLESFSTQVAG